jgi:hypothetical protein
MSTADPRPEVFRVGDCVVAVYAIGLLRPRVRHGTPGEVAGITAHQCPRAWPVCSKHAKLTRRNGHATEAPLPNIGPVVRSVPTVHRSQPAQQPRPSYARYEVRSGDSLSMIAQRHHVHGGWPELWRINRTNVPNPNVLFIGQVIHIPIPR